MVGTSGVTHHVATPFETATFGMGCFWGADSLFGATLGVLRTKVGYANGLTPQPTYRNIGDHTEVIAIDFDPTVITYQQLLELFWNNHEYGLTTRIKRQYASLILTHNNEQRVVAEKSRAWETKSRLPEVVITEIQEVGTFHNAEDYHQKYRLQSHKELAATLDLTPERLITSHVAARLNGYLLGVGGVKQFSAEADALGLSEWQRKYVLHFVKENEGGGLFC